MRSRPRRRRLHRSTGRRSPRTRSRPTSPLTSTSCCNSAPRFRKRPRCARCASIGIGPGRTFAWKGLSIAQKLEIGLGAKDGFAKITRQKDEIGTLVNGWHVGSAFGNRDFYNGDFLLRAGAALAGVFGNDAVEAMYPMTTHDGKTQFLIRNPISRYLINSSLLAKMVKNADGSVTLYIQNKAPAAALAPNWLPAPNGPIYLVMRLYWPKETPPSILPPGSGSWQPPAVIVTK